MSETETGKDAKMSGGSSNVIAWTAFVISVFTFFFNVLRAEDNLRLIMKTQFYVKLEPDGSKRLALSDKASVTIVNDGNRAAVIETVSFWVAKKQYSRSCEDPNAERASFGTSFNAAVLKEKDVLRQVVSITNDGYYLYRKDGKRERGEAHEILMGNTPITLSLCLNVYFSTPSWAGGSYVAELGEFTVEPNQDRDALLFFGPLGVISLIHKYGLIFW
ncbi:hypothetical protein [Bradyrhizobium sp. UNPF46]|uniref:hypothetical protein n=1 Tax=Bradyrhizobium sp. UNPF46 TaxID=1141168 RepID=UPI001153534D|nr:hypothetical protein [Bradyrhizobium sp. UNPF46]